MWMTRVWWKSPAELNFAPFPWRLETHKGKGLMSVAFKQLSDSFIFDVSISKKGAKMAHFPAFFWRHHRVFAQTWPFELGVWLPIDLLK